MFLHSEMCTGETVLQSCLWFVLLDIIVVGCARRMAPLIRTYYQCVAWTSYKAWRVGTELGMCQHVGPCWLKITAGQPILLRCAANSMADGI